MNRPDVAYFESLAREPRQIYRRFLKDCEPMLLRAVIAETTTHVEAAYVLGMSRTTFRKKLIQYGMLIGPRHAQPDLLREAHMAMQQ